MAEIEKVKLPNDDTIYDIKDAKAIRGLASGTTSGHVLQFGADGYTVSDSGKSMSDKQDTIDSSHKLSADLIDDTNATNKFATAAQLDQINTNKNNISSEQAKTVGMSEGGSDYITVGGIRVYVSSTAPTGARTGDLWIGG